ncbi:S8 family peptidase [Paenibacillus lemnae]|uniref:Peptidase S8 n=1 Tax=Paenibacillus lemnae TaxID=1330551 RepID=A0A848M4W2_PAELE|nr:S8 family peptidase [Paenibacillus lemnae]NMO94813.1 peptidase S8 [Paenibacillus lemnae]
MKSRRLWSLLGAVSILGLFLVILLSSDPQSREPDLAKNRSRISAPEEKTVKLSVMQGDLNATDRLSRLDARQHLQTLLDPHGNKKQEKIKASVAKHQVSHPQYEQIIWFQLRPGSVKEVFRCGPEQGPHQKIISRYMKQAQTQILKGKSYQSPTFQTGQQSYFVAAEPSSDKTYGAAAVVNHKVLSQVKNHQRKNLRLIPYPKEGSFKIESIHTDTLQDLTVKTGHDNQNASHYYENEIVVRFQQEPIADDMLLIASAIDGSAPRKLGNAYVFRSRSKNFNELKAYFTTTWRPVYAEPHYLYLTNNEPVNTPNDLLFSQYQWNLPAIETNRGWDLSKGSEDVVIAVIDTGIDLDHTDLRGQTVNGYNVVNPDDRPMDDVGHGTHVAGIISALVNNGEGVAGMSWYNKIMPIKALDSSGSGTTYAVAEGIIWAADHGAKVINMSLGNYADSQFLHDAVKYAYDRDVLLVAASGNDNTERPGFPAAYPEVLAVGATNSDLTRAEYSNYGDYIDVTAPGTNIASTYPGNQYAALSGTSMASPHVAAMAGLIRSLNPDLTNREVMDIMISHALDLGDKGKDKYFGNGQVDVFRSLKAAENDEVPLQMWPHHVLNRLQEELKRQQDLKNDTFSP